MNTDYCTQNQGDCATCSLVSYGKDCRNNRLLTLGDVAQAITGGDLVTMAKLLNDAGAKFDEITPDPGAIVPWYILVNLPAE
mgnify:CR=1 FL=1